jgi:chemotaxis protein MotB
LEQTELREEMRTELQRREGEARLRETEIAQLQGRIQRLEDQLRRTETDLAQADTEVGRLGMILGQRGEEFRILEQRLEGLRQVEREILERNQIYEDVLRRFQSLIDGGRLTVNIVRGRMVIQLPQDILFQSGSAALAAEGRQTLREVGAVLTELADRSFQVEGHTDDVPIATPRFPSNWELSSARAMSVIAVLLESGVSPGNLSGAGYGEYQPVASNDDVEGRRLNRRIEIVMLPNLDIIATTNLPN